MTANILTQFDLKAQLHYEPETGIFTWLVSNTNSVKVGDIAGFKMPIGYMRITINNTKYYVHRLAWLYVHGQFPKNGIDHINGVKDDNRLSNLREASQHQNNLNVGARNNNKSGYKGVYFYKRDDKWRAKAKLNGEDIYLGLFTTPELASEAYQAFARLHHGEFYREA